MRTSPRLTSKETNSTMIGTTPLFHTHIVFYFLSDSYLPDVLSRVALPLADNGGAHCPSRRASCFGPLLVIKSIHSPALSLRNMDIPAKVSEQQDIAFNMVSLDTSSPQRNAHALSKSDASARVKKLLHSPFRILVSTIFYSAGCACI